MADEQVNHFRRTFEGLTNVIFCYDCVVMEQQLGDGHVATFDGKIQRRHSAILAIVAINMTIDCLANIGPAVKVL